MRIMIFRKATMADVSQMFELINGYARESLMLRRPLMSLYECVRDFSVADDHGRIVATGGLHILWHDLAEIRSLSVHRDLSRKGIGRQLVEFLLQDARNLGLVKIFAFTYNQAFFEKCGFKVVKKETLPQKVWKECIYCDKFHNCDEIAVARDLDRVSGVSDCEIPLIEIPYWTVN